MKRKLLIAWAMALLAAQGMALAGTTVLYFSTSSAGAGNGTSWADRAALFDGSNNWSTVLTAIDIAGGSNSIEARVGPGSYTCGELLQSSTFTGDSGTAPTAANPLYVVACDSSGNRLAVPSPGWTSARPCWTTTNMPTIATTGNISTCSLANCSFRLIHFTASGRNGAQISTSNLDWCLVEHSYSGSSAVAVSAAPRVTNAVIRMSGTSWSSAILMSTGLTDNVRCEGNPSASSDNRYGATHAFTGGSATRLTVIGFDGGGIVSTSTNTGHWIGISESVIVHNDGGGYIGHSTASQTAQSVIRRCMITDNGLYNVDAGAERLLTTGCHVRDGVSGNFNNMGNYQTDFNDTATAYAGSAAARQAADYVDWASGVPANMDLRIKHGSDYWGKGYGVEDECDPGIPLEQDVQTGSGTFGYGSNPLTPAFDAPGVGDVRDGTTYGYEGEFTGVLVIPDEADVRLDVDFGSFLLGAYEFTGTYAGGGGSVIVIDD